MAHYWWLRLITVVMQLKKMKNKVQSKAVQTDMNAYQYLFQYDHKFSVRNFSSFFAKLSRNVLLHNLQKQFVDTLYLKLSKTVESVLLQEFRVFYWSTECRHFCSFCRYLSVFHSLCSSSHTHARKHGWMERHNSARPCGDSTTQHVQWSAWLEPSISVAWGVWARHTDLGGI